MINADTFFGNIKACVLAVTDEEFEDAVHNYREYRDFVFEQEWQETEVDRYYAAKKAGRTPAVLSKSAYEEIYGERPWEDD